MNSNNISQKSRLVAVLLCFFLGFLGFHRFYLKRVWTGLLQILLTFFLAGTGNPSNESGAIAILIWPFCDFIVILCGSFRDGNGRRVFFWIEPAPNESPEPNEDGLGYFSVI
jgi:hypothetical protein